MALSMDKAGTAVATRPLTPQVGFYRNRGNFSQAYSMLAGSPQPRRRFLRILKTRQTSGRVATARPHLSPVLKRRRCPKGVAPQRKSKATPLRLDMVAAQRSPSNGVLLGCCRYDRAVLTAWTYNFNEWVKAPAKLQTGNGLRLTCQYLTWATFCGWRGDRSLICGFRCWWVEMGALIVGP